MGVLVEGGAEVVDEGDGADLGVRTGPGALLLEGLLDDAQHDAQCGAADCRVALQEVAQALGKRDDPLAHREGGEDVVDEMRRRLCHPPRHAGRTDTAPLAGEGDEKIVTAGIAVGARKAAGEDAAFQEAAKFAFDVRRNGIAVPILLARQLQIGRQPFLHHLIQGRALRTPPAVGRAGARLRRDAGHPSGPAGSDPLRWRQVARLLGR